MHAPEGTHAFFLIAPARRIESKRLQRCLSGCNFTLRRPIMKTLRTTLFTAALISALLGGVASAQTAPPARMEGGVLVGTNGMTLYTFDKDAGGKSACNGPCAGNWPPLAARDDDKASGDWSVITRDDGSKQWAYKSRPLYFWAKDQKAGDRTGDGFNSVWHVAQ
jgi:predicted lipoprotein with Yx(FWY)xxD motif